MFRIDGPGAVGELPVAREGVNAPGFFGPGNPATGQMSTRVTYEWLNAVQEEIAAVITGAGIELSKENNAQLLAALGKLTVGPEAVFTPPTASAPGKAGLVPGPEAMPENELLLNLLSAKGFMKIDPSALFPSAESVELNKTTLALGGELVVNLAIDQLRRSGWFAGSFTGTLPAGVSEGILLNLLIYNNSDQLYYRTQLLVAYNNSKIYRRGSYGFAPGGTITSDSQWQELGAFAPIPTLSAGVGQVFVAGNGYHTLPAGGTWYVQTLGITIDQGITTGTAAFLAGGTQVGSPGTGWVLAQCLYA